MKKEILEIGMKLRTKYNEQKPKKPSKARQSNKSKTKDKMKPLKGMKKKHEYSAKMSTTWSDNSSSEEEDENESDGEEEICSLTKEQIIKTKPSEMWAVDTGATSSMTDNRDLFSDIRRIKRVPIQVGGGELYSNDSSTVRMDGLDRSTGLLSNVLWVPNLGVNILSARSVCKYRGFTGSFDDNDMCIMKGKKVKIHATLDGGLYVVNHIAHESRQKAFTATLQPIHKLRRKDQQEAFTSNTKSWETNEEMITPKTDLQTNASKIRAFRTKSSASSTPGSSVKREDQDPKVTRYLWTMPDSKYEKQDKQEIIS
jgi:hypothetical protein